MRKSGNRAEFCGELADRAITVGRRSLLAIAFSAVTIGVIPRYASANPLREAVSLETLIGAHALKAIRQRFSITSQNLPLSRETREDVTAFLVAACGASVPIRVPTTLDREIVFQLMGVLTDGPGFEFNVRGYLEGWDGGDCRWWMTKRITLSI